MNQRCRYCGQTEATSGGCRCPSLSAHEYWKRRGRGELPATVRFTAEMEAAPLEEPDEQFLRERDRGFKIDDNYDANLTFIQGYPERSR